MSPKLKIIFIIICLIISILIIRYINVDKDFSNLALGKETTTVFAKDLQGRTIHISTIDSFNKQIILQSNGFLVEKFLFFILSIFYL